MDDTSALKLNLDNALAKRRTLFCQKISLNILYRILRITEIRNSYKYHWLVG